MLRSRPFIFSERNGAKLFFIYTFAYASEYEDFLTNFFVNLKNKKLCQGTSTSFCKEKN